jgi:predicted permease
MGNLRFALRLLVKRPAFSAIVVVMLALGIGVTTAMFSLYHTVLLEPLDVPDAGQLVNLGSGGPKWGSMTTRLSGGPDEVFSYAMFRDLEAGQDVFSGIAAHFSVGVNFATCDRNSSGTGLLVSGQYFDTLRLRPTLGRLIGPADEPGLDESPVVVLSHGFWQSYFAGDAGVLGRTLRVNGAPLTIIGVAPEGFDGTTLGAHPDVFVPLTMAWRLLPSMPRNADDRRSYWLYVFARLLPGVTRDQAEAAVSSLHRGILEDVEVALNEDMPDDLLERFRQRGISLTSGSLGQSRARDNGRAALNLLLGVTSLVLVIVCVNIANLLLARGATRAGEIAIRSSVGASQRQLVAQFMAETGVLALLAAVLSLPIAGLTLNFIVQLLPDEQAAALDIGLDGAAASFAALVTLLTLLVFGVVPALRGSRTDPGLVIKGQSPNSAGGRGVDRFRRSLATAQIALSVVLLVLAGLFAQSLRNIGSVDLGMNVESLVGFRVAPRRNGYSTERVRALYDRLEEELAAMPGVVGAASSKVPILTGSNWSTGVEVPGFEEGPGVDTDAWNNDVSPGYFDTLSIPLLAGRDFSAADTADSPHVAIVNESFLRKFGLGTDVIGSQFRIDGRDEPEPAIEIIGVVADAKYSEVKDEAPPQFFVPRRQNPDLDSLSFYVRAALEPEVVMQRIRPLVAAIDSSLPIDNLMTMERTVRENVFLDRMITILSAGFAALATVLAAIGLYGVLAYSVTQRTRELGLRLALGETPGGLRRLVLAQVGQMALIGIPVGLAGAMLIGRLAESLLFGLSSFNALVLAAAVLLIAVVVFAAGLLPALRASSVTPMQALRYE